MQLPTPGDVFKERYRIEDELGAGGFSRVYLARDTRSERRVALKLVIPDGEEYSREMRARFGREVRIIANLGHPNTVTLLDCSTSDDDQLDRLRDDHTFDTAIPGVDPHLSKVIGRMTARDPEARYPSAAAALAALERPDVDPREARTTRKLLRPTAAREKPPTSWVIAGVSAAILLAFLFVFASSNPDEPPVVSPPAQRSALHSIIAANDEPAPVADAAAPAIDAAPDVGPTLPPYASAGCAKPARVLPEIVRLPADSDPQTPLPAIVWLHAHNEPATNIPDTRDSVHQPMAGGKRVCRGCQAAVDGHAEEAAPTTSVPGSDHDVGDEQCDVSPLAM